MRSLFVLFVCHGLSVELFIVVSFEVSFLSAVLGKTAGWWAIHTGRGVSFQHG